MMLLAVVTMAVARPAESAPRAIGLGFPLRCYSSL